MKFSLIAILLALAFFQTLASETPAELEARGIAALKLSQTEPAAIVTAAIYFAQAEDGFEKSGDGVKATETNSFLYWCKKKMTLAQMDVFLKNNDEAIEPVAKRLKEIEKVVPKASEAKLYTARAEAYAREHPDEHLLIAIRFYEIADRFKGSDVSLTAQDRSLQEMTRAAQSGAADPKIKVPAAIEDTKSKTAAAPVPAGGIRKSVVPSLKQQKETEQTIREVFKDDFAKSTPADKLELVQKLCAQAADSKNDAAAQYTLLLMAANMAAEASDVDAMLACFDKLADGFEGEFDILKKFNLGIVVAHSKDPNITKLAMAFKTLLEKPDDASASLLAGLHLCFAKGDYEHGLPLLAKSSNPALSKLAKEDLTNPLEPATQITLGDAWWEAGEKNSAAEEKHHELERASFWYRKALPALSGLTKVKLEKRLQSILAPVPNADTTLADAKGKTNLPPRTDAAVQLPGAAQVTGAPDRPRPRGASLSQEELHIQSEFKKGYNNPDRESRKAAIGLLANTYHPSSWQLLANAAVSDPNDSVRIAAVTVLAQEPAHDGMVGHLLAQCFSSLKPADTELKLEFARAMAPTEFKQEVVAVLAECISKMRYPDLYASSGFQGQNNNFISPETNRKIRKHYADLLEAFNVISNSDVQSANYEASRKVKLWWEANQQSFAKADRDLANKYRKEDEAAK